jgi:concanavalin A-like lectin/glucanase superfamily protein
MRRALVAVGLIGCGRIAFDPYDPTTPGPSGLALRVDGAGTYATLDALCDALTGDFTIEAWVYPDAVQPDGYASVFALNDSDGTTNLSLFMWDTTPPQTRFDYFDDVYANTFEGTITGAGGRWSFLAAVMTTAGTGALYQDGAVANTITTTRTVTAPCRFSLGQEWDGANASDFFAGYLDDLLVWTVAKSQDEVLADQLASPRGDEPGLASYITFDGDFPGMLVGATLEPPPP